MKLRTVISGLVAALAAITTTAQASTIRSIQVEQLFVPQGYDDNDEIVLLVSGHFESTCEQVMDPVVTIDHDARTIHVDAREIVLDGSCISLSVPYATEFHVGSLRQGEYKVVAGQLTKSLQVEQASLAGVGTDNFLYAPVASATVKLDASSNGYKATLRGTMPSNCLEFKDLQVLNQGEVIVILPIIEQVIPQCDPVATAFTKEVALPAALTPGAHLLHVRSMNGQAQNVVFTVNP